MDKTSPTAEGAPPTETQPTAASTQTPAGEAPPAAEAKPDKPWVRAKVVHVKEHQRQISPRTAPTVQDKPAPPAAAAGAAAGPPAATATSSDPKGSAPASGAGTPAGAGSAPAPPVGSAAPTTPEKPAEPEKPPLSKGWATLLEREAKLTQTAADLKPLIEARDLLKQGKRLAAMEKLGVTLDEAQLEYLDSTGRKKTAEEIAAAVYERRETERKAAEEATKTEQQTQAQQQHQAQIQVASQGMADAFVSLPEADTKYLKLSSELFGTQPIHTLQWWVNTNKAWPTDFPAAVKAHNEFLRTQLASKGLTEAVANPPPPAAAAPDKSTAPTAKARTSPNITSADAGEVPLRATVKRKETAIERVQRLAAEMNEQQP